RCLTLLFALGLLAVAARGQEREQPARASGLEKQTRPAPSELARENLKRVAASAGQIREVLLKDAGLMVELKRWVAREAAENGQVVEDGSLTDQAVFERLEQDVEFRSLATALLERYGYLTPRLNPESELGKQQELLLQARARRMAQAEAQEEAAS